MAEESIRIFSLGDSALTVEFGLVISPDLNKRAIALAEYFEAHPFPGMIETLPAYASTTLFFDPFITHSHFADIETAADAVRNLAEEALQRVADSTESHTRTVEIPVHFDEANGPDLDYLAREHQLSTAEVIEIFTAGEYRVYMLGFLPGFSYMGEVDERIATPRKETPRTSVPAGSVGIAGRQTGIYSLASPGGWQIIGRTDLAMFNPSSEEPCLLRAGDTVKFHRTE